MIEQEIGVVGDQQAPVDGAYEAKAREVAGCSQIEIRDDEGPCHVGALLGGEVGDIILGLHDKGPALLCLGSAAVRWSDRRGDDGVLIHAGDWKRGDRRDGGRVGDRERVEHGEGSRFDEQRRHGE